MKSFEDKIKEIKEGKNLEEYLHDEDMNIRAEVARQGYGLDKLVRDKDWRVRSTALDIMNQKY